MANTQLHDAWQRQLVKMLVIFPRTVAAQHGCGQSQVATALADGTLAALLPTLGMKVGEFPARQQTPQAKGLPQIRRQKRHARPLGASVHDTAVPVLPAVRAAAAAGVGLRAGPVRAPGGWVLGTGGPDLVHIAHHRSHVRHARASPYPCVRCNSMHWWFHPCPTGAQ